MILIKDHSDKFKVKKKKNVNFVSVFFFSYGETMEVPISY